MAADGQLLNLSSPAQWKSNPIPPRCQTAKGSGFTFCHGADDVASRPNRCLGDDGHGAAGRAEIGGAPVTDENSIG